MLLPTNIVVINLDDLWVIFFKILGTSPSLFFSSSMCNLFAETKAISIPEKKADNKIEIRIIISSISMSIKNTTYFDYFFFLLSF